MIFLNRPLAMLCLLCAFMRPVNALSTTSEWNSIDVIPAAVSKGKSEAKFTSSDFGFDAQHIKPINASAWEWYYFDAVSVDGLHSVAIVMYTAPATGFFGGGPPDDIIVSEVFASTPQNPQFFDQYTLGSEAIVSSIGNGANGLWKGTGFRFGGKHDLSSVNVEIDSPQIGVKGCVKLKSIAPPHYPCGPAVTGQRMDVMPHVGWANAIPDAQAEVDLLVNGTRVKFTGIGYHDKNWGDVPFASIVGSWVWGHGRLGPYSIVWWDSLAYDGKNYISGYASSDGKIVSVGCTGVKVRPSSKGAVYPPVLGSPDPTSYHVKMHLGTLGTLEFDVKEIAHVVSSEGYDRWTGRLSGGIQGQKKYTGISIYEQFTLKYPS